MKRLLLVLFGVLVFQGSVWAQCPDAKVLSPGANSVLIKDLPFVLQWQDDDLCLGKQVTIDLVDDKGKSSRIAYMKNKKDYKVKHPNSGFLNIDRLIAPESDHKYRFKISPAKKAQGQESIESEPIVVRLSNSFQKKGGALGSRSDASIPYQIGDLLTRIAALEATVKALEGADGAGGDGGAKYPIKFGGITIVQGTEWSKVVAAAYGQVDSIPKDVNACWCSGPESPAGYCKAEGWVVGQNSLSSAEDQLIIIINATVNRPFVQVMLDDGWGGIGRGVAGQNASRCMN